MITFDDAGSIAIPIAKNTRWAKINLSVSPQPFGALFADLFPEKAFLSENRGQNSTIVYQTTRSSYIFFKTRKGFINGNVTSLPEGLIPDKQKYNVERQHALLQVDDKVVLTTLQSSATDLKDMEGEKQEKLAFPLQVNKDLDPDSLVAITPHKNGFGIVLLPNADIINKIIDKLKDEKGNLLKVKEEKKLHVLPFSKLHKLDLMNNLRWIDGFKYNHLHKLIDDELPENGHVLDTFEDWQKMQKIETNAPIVPFKTDKDKTALLVNNNMFINDVKLENVKSVYFHVNSKDSSTAFVSIQHTDGNLKLYQGNLRAKKELRLVHSEDNVISHGYLTDSRSLLLWKNDGRYDRMNLFDPDDRDNDIVEHLPAIFAVATATSVGRVTEREARVLRREVCK